MRKTINYGLALYDKEDKMIITAEENSLNANMELIDGALKAKANAGDIPIKLSQLENDEGYLSSIPLDYVTENELLQKNYATESFVSNKIAEAELSGSDVDLSGLATKAELNNKVDKVKGKSLIDDTEIERLKIVTNYDDTEIRKSINSKASITDMATYIEEHKEELKGADGKDGTNGTNGKDGTDGQDGFSPTAKVETTSTGATITITDKNGTTITNITNGKDGVDGKDGQDGAKGTDGKDGEKGADGVSATHSWNGTTLTITSASGTSSANLKGDKGEKGDKGDTGSSGKDGKTPVKGTDYFTESDIEEIATRSAEKVNIQEINSKISEIDSALFERTDGKSIYNPETMVVSNTVLNIRETDIGTVCMNKTYEWDGVPSTKEFKCEANKKYILLGEEGNAISVSKLGVFDSNGVLLSFYKAPYETIIETPDNAMYIKIAFSDNDQAKKLKSVQYYEEDKKFYNYVVGEYPKATEKFVVKPTKKPIVIIMHDGGSFDNRADILAEYGFHGTFCINAPNLEYMPNDCKELISRGHDVALYAGIGTRPSTYVTGTDEKTAWYNYIKAGLDKLNEKGVYLPTQYGCPEHKGSKYITEICRELGFKYISCSYELHNGETMETDNSIKWCNVSENDPDNILFCPTGLTEETSKNREKVDNAIANNYIIGLFTHSVEDIPTVNYNLSTTAYRDILSYVKEKQDNGEIEVLTMRELYNKYHDWEGKQLDFARAMSSGGQGPKGDTGATGSQGPKGDKGDAPIKGTDYWTEADKKEIITEVNNVVKKDGVPDYWLSALQEGAEAINTALCEAGSNKSAFLFYSDAHWNYGSQMSPTLLKYLYKHTGMNKTIFGGDIVNDEATDYDTMEYLWEWRKQLKDLPNHHSVVGNHDDGNSTNNLFSENYVYGYLLAPEETNDVVRGDGGMYYYIDNNAEKTRYLYLDTAYQGVNSTQQEFIKQALLTTKDGWHIVVIAHAWYYPDYDQYNVRPIPIKGMDTNASTVVAMLDAYNSRIGDYADCGGWVEFCIGGHVHIDYDGTSSTGIPIILVETDSKHTRSGLSYTAETTTEASVNGIIADYDKHKIYVVRIGRGESREVAITNYVVTYTNQIPLSLAADGTSIYNEKGFKEDVRWSQSGQSESTSTGTYLTGWIPAAPNDVIRLANMTTTSSNFSVLTSKEVGKTTGSANHSNVINSYKGVTDDNGNIIQFTIPSSATWTYFRIACGGISLASIITKNEPIE